MLQLSAPSQQAARAKIQQLPHGSWGIVRIPNDQRVMVFSICGDDIQSYSYNAVSFAKNYNSGMAAMLKNHAAKPPVNKEEQRKKYQQQYNNLNDDNDRPTDPISSDTVPVAPPPAQQP